MLDIKKEVLKQFPDAKCVPYGIKSFNIYSNKIEGGIGSTEEEAWLSFYDLHCKSTSAILTKSYKDLVLEQFPEAQVNEIDITTIEIIDDAGAILSSGGYYKKNEHLAWKNFYDLHCQPSTESKTIQLPIIGNEYEFSDDGENWITSKFEGYSCWSGIFDYIRPIQENPKLTQLKQLAEELNFTLIPK